MVKPTMNPNQNPENQTPREVGAVLTEGTNENPAPRVYCILCGEYVEWDEYEVRARILTKHGKPVFETTLWIAKDEYSTETVWKKLNIQAKYRIPRKYNLIKRWITKMEIIRVSPSSAKHPGHRMIWR